MAGLQILSMHYPPSSNVSYFNKILFISHQNDRLIGGGEFIPCIISLSNNTKIPNKMVYYMFRSVVQSNQICEDL